MAISTDITINKLTAVCNNKTFDVLRFEVTRTLDAFPSCVIMLSSDDLDDDSLPIDANVSVELQYTTTTSNDKMVLFYGYISSELIDVRSGPTTYQDYRAYRLSCKSEKIICIPPTSCQIVTNIPAGKNNMVSQGSAYLSNILKKQLPDFTDKTNKNVASAIINIVDKYRIKLEQGRGIDNLEKLIIAEDISFTIADIDNVRAKIAELAQRYLASSYNYYDTLYAISKHMYLSLVPSRNGSGEDIMKICYRPGWVKDGYTNNEITAEHYNNIRSSTVSGSSRDVDSVILDYTSMQARGGAAATDLSGYVTYPPISVENGSSRIWKTRREVFPSWLTPRNQIGEISKNATALAKTMFADAAYENNSMDLTVPLVIGLTAMDQLGYLFSITNKSNGLKYIGQLYRVKTVIDLSSSKIVANAYLTFSKTVSEEVFKTYQIPEDELLVTHNTEDTSGFNYFGSLEEDLRWSF